MGLNILRTLEWDSNERQQLPATLVTIIIFLHWRYFFSIIIDPLLPRAFFTFLGRFALLLLVFSWWVCGYDCYDGYDGYDLLVLFYSLFTTVAFVSSWLKTQWHRHVHFHGLLQTVQEDLAESWPGPKSDHANGHFICRVSCQRVHSYRESWRLAGLLNLRQKLLCPPFSRGLRLQVLG